MGLYTIGGAASAGLVTSDGAVLGGSSGGGGGSGSGGAWGSIDNTHSPVAVYNFAGNLNDSSTNNLHLSDQTGDGGGTTDVEFYEMGGKQWAYFANDGTTWCTEPTGNALLSITGDMTAIGLVWWPAWMSETQALFEHGNDGVSTEADNINYGTFLSSSTSAFTTRHEYGSGSDITMACSRPVRQYMGTGPMLYSVVRDVSAGTYTHYFSGAEVETDSFSSNVPTGGASGQLFVGAAHGGDLPLKGAYLGAVAIYDTALTGPQLRGVVARLRGAAS